MASLPPLRQLIFLSDFILYLLPELLFHSLLELLSAFLKINNFFFFGGTAKERCRERQLQADFYSLLLELFKDFLNDQMQYFICAWLEYKIFFLTRIWLF